MTNKYMQQVGLQILPNLMIMKALLVAAVAVVVVVHQCLMIFKVYLCFALHA